MNHYKQTIKKLKGKVGNYQFNFFLLKVALIVSSILILLIFYIQFFFIGTRSDDNNTCPEKIVHAYEYKRYKGKDVNENDMLHVQASDLKTVQKVCDLFDDCAAFNSNGWLKKSAHSENSVQADLYVKQPLKKSKNRCKPQSISTPAAIDFSEMLAGLKIFMYPTTIGHEHRPHRFGGYTIERKFVEILLKSRFLTKNANEATFFFIPIRCTSYIINASSEHLGILQAKRIIGEILEEIKTTYPYWSWSSGADHFYICAHEIGAGIGDAVLKNSIALVNTADYDDPYFMPHKDISIPSTPASGSNSLVSLQGGLTTGETTRDVLAFYAGDLQSGRIRPVLYNRWAKDDEMILINHNLPYTTYVDYLKRSKFCLIIRGREAWSPLLVEAIFSGCVPVIISNHYHLPLQGVVDWKKFSILIPESEVNNLRSILQDISPSKLTSMQIHLSSVYSRFVWNNPPKRHDAFYSVMLQLWRRRHVIQYRSAL